MPLKSYNKGLMESWPQQKKAYEFLKLALQSENFSSPFIFHGERGELLANYAKLFGEAVILLTGNQNTQQKLLSQNHPDIAFFAPEGKSDLFSMSEIRLFIEDISLPPYESRYKVYILRDVDRMLPVHANALLKTLEEKPSHAVIILTTETIKSLLPTIVSRCMAIPFVSEEALKTNSLLTDLVYRAIPLAQNGHYKELLTTIGELDKEIQKDEQNGLEEALASYLTYFKQNGDLRSLEEAGEIAAVVRESKERHTRTKIALEYLFLKPLEKDIVV